MSTEKERGGCRYSLCKQRRDKEDREEGKYEEGGKRGRLARTWAPKLREERQWSFPWASRGQATFS